MNDLTRFRDHCRKQADNDAQPAAWAQLWRMLADEVDRYLARDEPDVETVRGDRADVARGRGMTPSLVRAACRGAEVGT